MVVGVKVFTFIENYGRICLYYVLVGYGILPGRFSNIYQLYHK